MAKNESAQFPKVGEDVASHVMNLSGQRSPYTTTVGKKTMGRGSSPTGRYAKRGSSLIHEAHGPCFHIKATLYAQNAAAASDVERHVKIVPSRISHPDAGFWSSRQYAQGI